MLAFMLCGQHAKRGAVADDYVYVAMNMHWESHPFELPALPDGSSWHVFANTALPPPEDVRAVGTEPVLPDQHQLLVGARSVVILVGR